MAGCAAANVHSRDALGLVNNWSCFLLLGLWVPAFEGCTRWCMYAAAARAWPSHCSLSKWALRSADFRRGFDGSVNRRFSSSPVWKPPSSTMPPPRVGRRVCRRWSRYAAISQVDPTAFGPKKEGPRPLYLVPGDPEDVVNRKFVKNGCSIFSQRQDYIRWDLFLY